VRALNARPGRPAGSVGSARRFGWLDLCGWEPALHGGIDKAGHPETGDQRGELLVECGDLCGQVQLISSALASRATPRLPLPGDFDSWGDWEMHFRRECSLIDVLYASAGVQVMGNSFVRAVGGTAFDAAAAGHAAAADEQPATAGKAQAKCEVG
jgi:hypothetical protein